MAKYLLAYHGGGTPQSEEEQARVLAAWETWYRTLDQAVVDPGNPVGHARTVSRDRSVSEGGGSNPVSGYTVIQADSMDAALALVRGARSSTGTTASSSARRSTSCDRLGGMIASEG